MDNVVRVKIADLAVIRELGTLVTIGLGSCVGIAAYDPLTKVAGLAHILLSDSTKFPKGTNPAKYADTAVPLLIKEMVRLGASPHRIKAKIAGGSEMFQTYNNGLLTVGTNNVKAVKKALALARVPLLAEDVGGSVGRTMQLNAEDGRVFIKKVGQEPREI